MLIRTEKQAQFTRGFTLVELLVVMAVLVVLAGVTLPTVKGLLHDQKVSAAARLVKAHVEAAQARAISSNRRVAVILERNANDSNIVTRLSIGQTFPPYEGDVSPTLGTLGDSSGSSLYYNQITIPTASASLLTATPAVFGAGDFIQIGNSSKTYTITDISSGVVTFSNPSLTSGGLATQEPQLLKLGRASTTASFRIFRRPTKSFVQSSSLPRGTCIDMTVSGIGQTGAEFSVSGAASPLMIVFDPDGSIFSITDGSTTFPPSSITHLLVGRTEQVSLAAPLSVEDPDDSATFNANLNDNGNSWISINPITGMIYSSALQAGSENASSLATRLQVARSFATNAVTQSEN